LPRRAKRRTTIAGPTKTIAVIEASCKNSSIFIKEEKGEKKQTDR
jgi:hypothetical protein